MFDIKKEVQNIYEQVVAWRRDFHMYPELGYQEKRTSAKVAEILRSFGIEVQEGVGGYGVVGLLRGAQEGKTIALRADMDALPIQENHPYDYASKNPGVMHACGHDGHIAILLGTAAILSKMKDNIKGNVKFLFQPAEEIPPAGGAKPMVEAGALENPKVDDVIGLHLFTVIPAGSIMTKKGPITAASDNITIEVFGKGGHGAMPHTAKDALLAACQIVTALQMVVSRTIDPNEMGVVTIGKLESGTVNNVIARYAKMEGTVRTLNPEVRSNMEKTIGEIVEGIAKATGTTVRLSYEKGYPVVINDPDLTDLVINASLKHISEDKVVIMPKALSGSEDFSNFLVNGVRGTYFGLGAAFPGKETASNHHPEFDWDESAMIVGMEIFIQTVLDYFKDK